MPTTLYLRTGSADISRGRNDVDKLGNTTPWRAFQLSEQSGSGANTSIQISTVAGPTNGLTLGVGAVDYEWLSPPILEVRNTSNNITTQLLGKITSSLYAIESANSVNAGIGVKLEVVDRSGSIKTSFQTYVDTVSEEIGTANTAVRQFVTQVGSGPDIEKGDRLRVEMFFDDAGGTMGAGTATFFYDGTTANFGSSRLTFEDTITFLSAPTIQNGYVETGITASDAENSDRFGYSVACSQDGSTVVVGAYLEDGAGTDRGKVYVYSGTNYTTERMITQSSPVNSNRFGYSVACSQDASVIVVGTPYAAVSGTDQAGKVYVYSGTNYAVETLITASDFQDSDRFGYSVACSQDGSVVVVGADGEDGAGSDRGKVYVYSGTNYTTERMITASDAANNDRFGNAVACSQDGSTVVVGAIGADVGGIDRGKAYIYSGTNYTTEYIFSASDGQDRDTFGRSVACSQDGSIVIVGGGYKPLAFGGTQDGKLYVYSGTNYTNVRIITASNPTPNGDLLGYSNNNSNIRCSPDASVIVAGAPAAQVGGRTYIFSGTNWSTETIISQSDAATSDYFGYAVACSTDISIVVAGAYLKNSSRGKVYVNNITNTAFLTDLANNIGTNGKHAWYDRGNG